ncbi:MAG: uncharacterized protein A8A55_1178 [Amphiamblys sp. WSBS2006]|nr:MAG: uncharacterized protein A8A55_1178 [Amphiamblys sp. WSBS2006]
MHGNDDIEGHIDSILRDLPQTGLEERLGNILGVLEKTLSLLVQPEKQQGTETCTPEKENTPLPKRTLPRKHKIPCKKVAETPKSTRSPFSLSRLDSNSDSSLATKPLLLSQQPKKYDGCTLSSESDATLTPTTALRISRSVLEADTQDLSSTLCDLPHIVIPKRRLSSQLIDLREYGNLPEEDKRKVPLEELEESARYIYDFLRQNQPLSVLAEDILEDCVTGMYPKDCIRILVFLGILSRTPEGYSLQMRIEN